VKRHPFREFLTDILMLAAGVVIGCVIWIVGAALRGAEPIRKPTLTLAVDDGPRSKMLRNELTRDWLAPNPCVHLSRRQRNDLAVVGHSMNALRNQIAWTFRIQYVCPEQVPMPERLHLPAVRINRGRWESIDRRAFAFETRPLLTLDWYRARYVAVFDRDSSLDALADYGCTDEGYSGAANVELPAPWEISPASTTHE
jgi:hypothetical protein